MKYVISRSNGDVSAVAHQGGAYFARVPHVVYHSPTGFETGYAGSGPSDLALSILAYHLAVEPQIMRARILTSWAEELPENASRVMRHYQNFKMRFIAHNQIEDGESYEIVGEEIDRWLAEAEAKEVLP